MLPGKVIVRTVIRVIQRVRDVMLKLAVDVGWCQSVVADHMSPEAH
jgi:hypothetical protein